MALARVQATPSVFATFGTVAVTFTAPPTVGNGIVFVVLGAALTTVTDTHGQTYTVAKAQVNGSRIATIYYLATVGLTGAPFTITGTGATGNRIAIALEVSGVGSGLVIDQTSGAGATSTAPATGATPALLGAEVFVVAGFYTTTTQASIVVDSSTPTWIQEMERLGPSAGGEADSRIVGSAAGTTQAASWTITASAIWAAAVAAFRAGAPAVVERTDTYVWGPL